jgi:hypothetical protein
MRRRERVTGDRVKWWCEFARFRAHKHPQMRSTNPKSQIQNRKLIELANACTCAYDTSLTPTLSGK